jgi:hypothetical protein
MIKKPGLISRLMMYSNKQEKALAGKGKGFMSAGPIAIQNMIAGEQSALN